MPFMNCKTGTPSGKMNYKKAALLPGRCRLPNQAGMNRISSSPWHRDMCVRHKMPTTYRGLAKLLSKEMQNCLRLALPSFELGFDIIWICSLDNRWHYSDLLWKKYKNDKVKINLKKKKHVLGTLNIADPELKHLDLKLKSKSELKHLFSSLKKLKRKMIPLK